MSDPNDSESQPPAPQDAAPAHRRRAREREEGGGTRSAPFGAAIARSGLRLAGALSFPAIYRLGGAAGRMLASVPGDARRATSINLEMCMHELDRASRAKLARASLTETGRTLLELGALWTWPRERVLALVREEPGVELLRAALARGKGVLMMTPHLGAWEMTSLYVSSIAPLTAMYKPPRVREMEAFYKNARERLGTKLVPADASGVRALHRALRSGEIAGILPDQDPGRGSGLFVPFFGILANTTTLIAKLVSRTRPAVLFIWAERLPAGAGFRVHIVEPSSPDLYDDQVEVAVRAMNRELEDLIRTAPQQYLWSYKRFRYRPPGLKNPYRHGVDEHTAGSSHAVKGLGLAAALLASACTSAPPAEDLRGEDPRGELVIVGGGGTSPEMIARALELARARESYVVVLPQASEQKDRGVDSAQMWRDAGAAEVVNLTDLSDRENARRELERADLIWFGGGDQSKLVAALRESQLLDVVRDCHRRGATCGGTSAGAAVMSPLMITGEGEEALTSLSPGATELVEGIGLLPGTIVDQHFVARQRSNRLLSAVLDHPDHVGLGIDERTAFVVVGGRGEVIGEGAVVVYDARKAALEPRESGRPCAARQVELHVLRSGMTFELAR